MTDQEFLLYCQTHCASPRAAFVPQQIARLLRLAGKLEAASAWDEITPTKIIDDQRNLVKRLVHLAELRLKFKPLTLAPPHRALLQMRTYVNKFALDIRIDHPETIAGRACEELLAAGYITHLDLYYNTQVKATCNVYLLTPSGRKLCADHQITPTSP